MSDVDVVVEARPSLDPQGKKLFSRYYVTRDANRDAKLKFQKAKETYEMAEFIAHKAQKSHDQSVQALQDAGYSFENSPK